jgi:hypothetical protein
MSQPQPLNPGHPLTPKLGFAPGPILRICGMRRSGNHAITDWLQRNSPTGGSVFLNNCRPGKRPLATFRGLEVNGQRAPVKPALDNLPDSLAAAGDGAMLLISYEDTLPTVTDKPLSGPFDETQIDNEIAIYRGFLNWSASLVKKLQRNPGFSLSRRASIVLRATDTYSAFLELVQHQKDLGVTGICYDDWLRSEPYRAGILSRLGLPLRDNALGPVQPYGGGSSFQKDADTPAQLATDRRWHQMADDPEYCGILQIASQDTVLMTRLSAVFPQDVDKLRQIIERTVSSKGGLP